MRNKEKLLLEYERIENLMCSYTAKMEAKLEKINKLIHKVEHKK